MTLTEITLLAVGIPVGVLGALALMIAGGIRAENWLYDRARARCRMEAEREVRERELQAAELRAERHHCSPPCYLTETLQ